MVDFNCQSLKEHVGFRSVARLLVRRHVGSYVSALGLIFLAECFSGADKDEWNTVQGRGQGIRYDVS